MATKPNTQNQREKLEARRKQIDEQLKRIANRDSLKRRKDDTRKKIIVGAIAIAHAERDEEFRHTLYHLVSKFTVRPQDRVLFGLDPLEPSALEKERPLEA
jgi:hypothetical protein